MSRYLIQAPSGLFYTGNTVPETVYVPSKVDPSRNDLVMKLQPQFDAVYVMQALKYEEASDAESIFSNPDLVDPKAFDGCKVFECEFDSKNPSAMR